MHVSQLLNPFARIPHLEIIEAMLPDMFAARFAKDPKVGHWLGERPPPGSPTLPVTWRG
jgi:hypothetical protein